MEWEYISDESFFGVLKNVFKTNKFVLVSPYGKNGYKFYLDKVYESEISDLKELLNSDSYFVNNFYCDEKYYIFKFYLGYLLVMFKGDLQEIFIERIKAVLKIIEIVYEYINKKKRLKDAIEENNRLIEEVRLNYQFIKEILDNLNSAVVVLDENDDIVLSNVLFKKNFTDKDLEFILNKSKDKFELNDKHYKVFLREIKVEENFFKVLLLIDITDIVKYEREISKVDRLASIGQLTAGIAHDFNNILTGISGMAYAVKSMESDKNKINLLTNIEKLVDRAANIIKQLLDFARKSEGQKQRFDLVPYLKEFIKMLKETFPKNIHLNIKYDNKDTYNIEIDPVHLDRILMNLCVNAKDAIGDKEGEINIQISNIEIVDNSFKNLVGLVKNGQYILISVSDTGSGISDDIKDKIFDPYFTTKEHGNGLGLAQVYGLVKNNDGYITFESEENKGTTFYILLPSAKEMLDSSKESKLESSSHDNILKGYKILLIDDEEFILESLSIYLKQLGLEVDCALSADEALNLLKEKRYDLIISDYSLPGVKSSKFLEMLESFCKNLIVISGYLLNDFKYPFLKKPFKFEELVNQIKDILNIDKS
ncbi:ATP-binding protein [Deferribacter thermophilus]|uniref:ATP-binding protein n=1 Tax=Deferribacter thermophilus TaxID=53573 RepID=UPI003C22704B